LVKRRDPREVECRSDIDEFIRRAQRWSALNVRLLSTLARIPEEVYRFTLENVSFHAGQSQTLDVKELTKSCMIILKRTDSESTIAHEIAHAYLGHAKTDNRPKNIEAEAETLRKSWGFKKKEICPSYPRWCLQCHNPHCSESQESTVS
jgi:hypothetical protein